MLCYTNSSHVGISSLWVILFCAHSRGFQIAHDSQTGRGGNARWSRPMAHVVFVALGSRGDVQPLAVLASAVADVDAVAQARRG